LSNRIRSDQLTAQVEVCLFSEQRIKNDDRIAVNRETPDVTKFRRPRALPAERTDELTTVREHPQVAGCSIGNEQLAGRE
jgi:hypothetical protein